METERRVKLNKNVEPNTNKQIVWQTIEKIGYFCNAKKIMLQLKEDGVMLDKNQLSNILGTLKQGGKIIPIAINGNIKATHWGMFNWFNNGKPKEQYYKI